MLLPRTQTVAAVGRLTGAYFALRSAGVLVCVRLLHMQPSAGAAASLALGPALLLFLIFHSMGATTPPQNGSRVSLRRSSTTRWLTAYLAFAGLSFLWGVAVSPASSAAYYCGLLIDVAILFLLLSRYPPRDVAGAVLHGYVLGACAIAVLAWLMPPQADLRLGDAEFFNTNQIANICAFGIFFAQYVARQNLNRIWFPVLLLSVTLLRTLSKTTLLAFLLSQSVLLFRDPDIAPRTRRKVLLCAAFVLAASSGLLAAYYGVYTNAGNQAETLTGRTAIWAWTLSQLPQSPWIGHGFDAMWKVMPPLGIDYFEARHAENEWLQQLYAYGIVGATLYTGVYVSLFRATQRLSKIAVRSLLKALLLYIFVRGFAEAEPFDLLLPVWTILLLTAVMVDQSESAGHRQRSKSVSC